MVLGAEWLYGTWPEDWKAFDITFLELCSIVLSSILLGGRFSNRDFEFCDQIGLFRSLHKQAAELPLCVPKHLAPGDS